MTIDHRMPVARIGHIKEDDLSIDALAKLVQLVEGAHHHDIRREAAFWCPHTAAEAQDVKGMWRGEEQLGGFAAPYPVGYHHRFGVDVGETGDLQAGLGPHDGLVQLRRAGQAVADAVAEPGEILMGAVGARGLRLQPLGGGAKGFLGNLGTEAGGDETGKEATVRIHVSS